MKQQLWITLATYLAYCIDKELYKAIDYLREQVRVLLNQHEKQNISTETFYIHAFQYLLTIVPITCLVSIVNRQFQISVDNLIHLFVLPVFGGSYGNDYARRIANLNSWPHNLLKNAGLAK